ncbi:MAG: M48 family metallopeptidase [Fimbriimonadales bacterium]|nr:M48 family metallopeptidase [Fimbriimonadales bacterium]
MRRRLPGLRAESFAHEGDRAALQALQKVPLLPKVIQKFHEVGLDRRMYLLNMASAVRCGPRQFRTVYGIFRECCAVLDVPEPELYVTANPFPNAFAGGVERPYITLRSSILDALDDAHLYHLIGHELGHVKAGHVLYKSVAAVLLPLLEMLGRRTFGLGDVAGMGLLMAMAQWSRMAELTADRAGLLASQSLETSIEANLRLCAGISRFAHELDADEFLLQARAYQDAGPADKVLLFLSGSAALTHPMPVHRAKELERWANSGAYDRILAGFDAA